MSIGPSRATDGPNLDIQPALSHGLIAVILLATFALGLFLRLIRFDEGLFPVSDGALFLAIVEAIQANQMALPTSVMFNSYELPFAYPPLGLWTVAAISSVSGIDGISIMAVFPLACNLLFVIAFVLMLRTLKMEWGIILVAFAVMVTFERSYEYLIMGGGVTRSPGSLFAILSITAAIGFRKNRSIILALLTGVLCGFSILSHLEWGIDCAVAVAVIVMFGSGTLTARSISLVFIGIVSLICISPWLYFVVTGPGLEPLSYASQTSGWSFAGPVKNIITLNFLPKYGLIFGAIGAWELAKKRQFEWHLIALAIVIFTPRHADSALVIPNSIFVAYGVMAIWLLVIDWTVDNGERLRLFAVPAFLSLLVVAIILNVFPKSGRSFSAHPSMEVLTSTARAGMEWTTHSVKPNAVFFVLSNEPWYVDEAAEWFPYLSGHYAVNTVQGTEWLPDQIWAQKARQYETILRAGNCNEAIENIWRIYPTVSHILATTDIDCLSLNDGLREIWSQNGVGIYERIGGNV